MVQTALVQESALKGAQARIANLEAKLAQASAGAAPEAPRRSFLSGLLGGEAPGRQAYPLASAPQPAAPAAAASPGPWGSRGAPSFLQSALSTAAGVAGGALLFQGIEHMLGYGGSPFANVAGAGLAQPAEDITVNNFETAPQDVAAGSNDPGQDSPDPSNDTTQVDDPGFDQGTTASATTAASRTSEGRLSERSVAAQPRPTSGILVAMTVRNRALASAGRSAMNSTAFATFETSITGSIASVPLA